MTAADSARIVLGRDVEPVEGKTGFLSAALKSVVRFWRGARLTRKRLTVSELRPTAASRTRSERCLLFAQSCQQCRGALFWQDRTDHSNLPGRGGCQNFISLAERMPEHLPTTTGSDSETRISGHSSQEA